MHRPHTPTGQIVAEPADAAPYSMAPMSLLFALSLAAAGPAPLATAPAGGPPAPLPFRTDALPRVDPVFGDITSLRTSVDHFLSLQTEMDGVRDQFSAAVHETLAALRPPGPTTASRQCPAGAAAPYARALSSGARFLALGGKLQTRYREIRRSDELGDTVGLTPDYRWKVKRAKDLYLHLLTDYREMRVAFYDQLGTELRHARCKLPTRAVAAARPNDPPNPSDPGAWVVEDALPDADPAVGRGVPLPTKPPADEGRTALAEPPVATGQPIWIDIDNTLCATPTRVTIDGQALDDISARKKTSLRTTPGPHDVCVLPSTDARTCGSPGTLRRAYLHEGWALTVYCNR